jgi:hypothetical protein
MGSEQDGENLFWLKRSAKKKEKEKEKGVIRFSQAQDKKIK